MLGFATVQQVTGEVEDASSIVHHTSAVISDLVNLLVISAHPLHRYCTSHSPELTSPIVLSIVQHPLFGSLQLLTLQAAVH